MADASQLQLNPYALFDPSQWANPYSSYQNSPLPQPGYVGMPTNYAGQQIQPTPGMTLNQTPSQPTPAPAAGNPAGQWAFNNSMLNAMGQQPGNQGPGVGLGNIVDMRAQNNAMYGVGPGPGGSVASPASAAAQIGAQQGGGGGGGGGLTPQQYMALRANPGAVPTYGATVPQAASSAQPGSGVLQQFLSNWKPASSGPGSGFQQGFAAALGKQGYRTS